MDLFVTSEVAPTRRLDLFCALWTIGIADEAFLFLTRLREPFSKYGCPRGGQAQWRSRDQNKQRGRLSSRAMSARPVQVADFTRENDRAPLCRDAERGEKERKKETGDRGGRKNHPLGEGRAIEWSKESKRGKRKETEAESYGKRCQKQKERETA
ncbi:hypothetical protein PUN28_000858 [Cardiocondyla obscurior]|uniref:Uncharacterized protein n=1 Tax=Cardiocondyla obscurior TaxID=286306 RepID=A0AAW2H1M8_9HYME